MAPTWELEERLWRAAVRTVAGVDEAGRGALAGPVVAAAVILKPAKAYPFRDSKRVTAKEREELALQVKSEAVAYATGIASALEVDTLNVLQATKLAALRALEALKTEPDGLVTDYLKLGTPLKELAVARADNLSYQVAAASILAKTTRDHIMIELDGVHPGYGFVRNKGYGVPEHLEAIARLGACPEHRATFGPVAARALFAPRQS